MCTFDIKMMASNSMAIYLKLTKSKRSNIDEIIYKFNKGYEFTSHFMVLLNEKYTAMTQNVRLHHHGQDQCYKKCTIL